MIYLDNHATTQVAPEVLTAMWPYFSEKYGNAASVNHAFGWRAAEAVARAREQIARLLNCPTEWIIFTSGATEANNLAIKGVFNAARCERPHFITNAAEHPSVLDVAKRLKRQGVDVTVLPVDSDGRVAPDQVAEAITTRTVLVSVMMANNEVGTINPLAEIGHICQERGVLLHSDAVQVLGKLPLDVSQSASDLLSFSAHKMHGPQGIGLLIVRRGERRIPLEPLFDGGGHEQHLRSGTLPVPLIVGFGAACELTIRTPSIAFLRDRLWRRLSSELNGLSLNGPPFAERLPNNLNVSVDGVDGDALMSSLKTIAVSSGSACSTANPEPSHVLRAMGISESLSRASLRFGLSRFTTESEIDIAADEVIAVVKQLRLSHASRNSSEDVGE